MWTAGGARASIATVALGVYRPGMDVPAPPEPAAPIRYTVDEYFALPSQGALGDDDRVELLEGVAVAMPPSGPAHAATIAFVTQAIAVADLLPPA
jgi:hypothetical protein